MKTWSGAPSWRLLAALSVLVVAAHVLLLLTSPARLGARLDPDANRTRAFATRSIEAATAPPAPVAVLTPAPRVRRPPPLALPASTPEIVSNPALAPVNIAPSAMDSIAIESTSTPMQSAASDSAGSTTVAVLTAAQSVPASSSPTLATAAAPAASTLPAGPKTTPVTAIKLPDSVLLQYKMVGTAKGLNYQANAELGWTNTGKQYDAFMKVSALFLGARIMTSAGQITPTGLAPTRFADKFRSEQAAHFEADKGKITFSANTPDAPWIEGAQDRVSVFVQLGGMLAAQPDSFAPGSEITLYTIGPRDADTWTFVVESEETLQLTGQDMATLKLIRKPRREFDQKVEIWYAPALGYLPVRNRITQQNGDFIDQQLSKLVRP